MPSLPLMTAAEVAAKLACSTDQVHSLISRGHLSAINIGTAGRPFYRVSHDGLETFLEAKRTNTTPRPTRRRKPNSPRHVINFI